MGKLEPGDVVFYDKILHCGVYDAMKERVTLHGSVRYVKSKTARARNVLQHVVGEVGEWVGRFQLVGLGEEERRRAEDMRKRMVRTGGDVGFDLGYSQRG